MKPIPGSAASLSVLLLALPLGATQPGGILGLVERVALEPDGKGAARAQVWGAFSLAAEEYGKFQAPARGYLYLQTPPGKEEAARKEWADLKRLAGSGKCVLFGNRWSQKVTLRKFDARPEAADEHPMSIGVQEVGERVGQLPVAALKKLRGPLSPQAGDTVAPGKLTVRHDEALVHGRPGAKFVFAIESGGEKEESEPTAAQGNVASWQPRLEARPGRKYTVRVWAVDGAWKGDERTTSFEVAAK